MYVSAPEKTEHSNKALNRKYLKPPAPDQNDPYKDFGPEVIYNGTKIDNDAWMSSTSK